MKVFRLKEVSNPKPDTGHLKLQLQYYMTITVYTHWLWFYPVFRTRHAAIATHSCILDMWVFLYFPFLRQEWSYQAYELAYFRCFSSYYFQNNIVDLLTYQHSLMNETNKLGVYIEIKAVEHSLNSIVQVPLGTIAIKETYRYLPGGNATEVSSVFKEQFETTVIVDQIHHTTL